MLRFDCYDFYKLAVAIHPLTELSGDTAFNSVWWILYNAKDEINTFYSTFPLKTSRQPATNLYRLLLQVIPDDLTQMETRDAEGAPRQLSAFEVQKISGAANEFQTVLKAELAGWDSLFISQKGAYSTTELLSQAELMIPEVGRDLLSGEALVDFRNAGMCIAFNLGTAAAFHSTRATESVIRLYYSKVMGTLPAKKLRNWGAYRNNLKQSGKADDKVLAWFEQVTNEYRNPVLHPDETLSLDDALEFIYACIALITSIGRAIKKLDAQVQTES